MLNSWLGILHDSLWFGSNSASQFIEASEALIFLHGRGERETARKQGPQTIGERVMHPGIRCRILQCKHGEPQKHEGPHPYLPSRALGCMNRTCVFYTTGAQFMHDELDGNPHHPVGERDRCRSHLHPRLSAYHVCYARHEEPTSPPATTLLARPQRCFCANPSKLNPCRGQTGVGTKCTACSFSLARVCSVHARQACMRIGPWTASRQTHQQQL